MDPRVGPLATTLSLNARLFLNCLDGVTDEQALARPSATTNNIGFVAAHVCDSRYFLLRFLGADAPSLFPELENAKTIDDVNTLPQLASIRAAWATAAQRLALTLQELTSDFLDAESATRFPVADPTRLGTLTFLVQHDTYHIGQLALLRRFVGLKAMSYR